MDWWIWVLAGLVWLIVEVSTPGLFVCVFFGVACMLVGLLTAAHLLPTFPEQAGAAALLAGASLVLFRRRLLRLVTPKARAQPVDSTIGEVVVAVTELPPGGVGKVEFRGTSWSGHNASQVHMPVGTRCVIARVDGLTLRLVPLEEPSP